MPHSIGKTIKDLRRKRGLTQEQLAEKIGVSAQAVSKWENESGMPDISQIVPLAHIFGVSTDLLLGTGNIKKQDDVGEILERAQKMITFPLSTECIRKKYEVLLEGLKIYPDNPTLLIQTMETEITLAYPENSIYDKENAKDIYESCIKHARSVISFDQNINRVLRARMIMVMLHSAYGNYEEARKHAEKFPQRTDFNVHKMYFYFAHWQKDYKSEAMSLQFEIMNLLHELMHTSVCLAKSYESLGEEENAKLTYERAIAICDAVFDKEIKMPFHHTEEGDLYVLLAEKCMQSGDTDRALSLLEEALGYDLEEKPRFAVNGYKVKTPLLSFVGKRLGDRYQNLTEILGKDCFAPLRKDERFLRLKEKAENRN